MDSSDGPGPDPRSYIDDVGRLVALARTGLADSAADPSFDRLARLASKLLRTPVALVSLVDDHRQFFKSCVGLPEPWMGRRETPMSHSFCRHVVETRKPLVIDDARVDPLVKDNPAVEDLGVVAYIGMPLLVDGHVIGSFCTIDVKPRAWSVDDIEVLADLTESVATEIRLRARNEELAEQRQHADETRRQTEMILASIGDAVIATDDRGLVTFLNPVAETLCGWSNGRAAGRPLVEVFRIVDEATRAPVADPTSRALAQGTIAGLPGPTLLIALDGTERSIEDGAAPIRLQDGSIAGTVLVFRDVTARRQVERSLIRGERRLRTALDAARMVAWEWDPGDGSLHTSENAAEVYGMPRGSTLARIEDGLMLVHPADLDAYKRAFGGALEHLGTYLTQYRLIRPDDGAVVWLEERGEAVAADRAGGVRLAGLTMDITERKLAEEGLRKREAQYRALFESIDEGFCVIEMIFEGDTPVDYRFVEINPAFEQITGWSGVVGRTVRELTPDLERFWFETYGAVSRAGESVRFEHEVEALGSRSFDVYVFRVGEPDRPQVAVLFNDITARKRFEADRERMVEQLREADRRKDEFLAMLAHELRNPLGVISSGVQLVEAVDRPEMLTQLRETIQHQVVHLTHLIDDLLDVSRITRGKIELRKKTVELAAIVGRAVEQVRPLVEEKQHDLQVALPPGPVRFVADPTRAEQILGNLLTNAAKYSGPRGSIRLSAARDGDAVVIRVRDAGDGISAEMLPKVFGLFTQVDATIHRSRGGLGIGLTLVRSLVEMHGGSVTAASEGEGMGSEFTVRLPIGNPSLEDPAGPLARSRAAGPDAGADRVLIVDDNVVTVRLTARMLRHHGYTVETAHDGLAAVEKARRFRPTIILLDIGLPGMNGYEVATTLRREGDFGSACLIAVSGYGERESRERSRAAGFDHHLTKPLDFGELLGLLQGQAAG